MKSRDKEIQIIKVANRASIVGKLLLGEINNWENFLKVETDELEYLPRKMLKSGKRDVHKRLSGEIAKFCKKNFVGMTQQKLSALYEDIKALRGLEISLPEFEIKYAKIKDAVLKGQPKHCTVCISLWGLQFKYPEQMLADDIVEAMKLINHSKEVLKKYSNKSHLNLRNNKDEISSTVRLSSFACRMCVLSSFNLVEAFLNGLAWDFSLDQVKMSALSERKKK